MTNDEQRRALATNVAHAAKLFNITLTDHEMTFLLLMCAETIGRRDEYPNLDTCEVIRLAASKLCTRVRECYGQ